MQGYLVAGDTLAFDTQAPTDADGNAYRASAGWAMTYRLVPRSGSGSVITITADADGDDFTVSVPSSTTAGWGAGWYSWAGYVSKAGNRYTFDDGQIEIKADPGAAPAGYDGRTHARKMLDAIEAALEAKATASQLDLVELEIYSRRSRRDRSVLLEARQKYLTEVRREEAAAGINTGRGRVYVRY